MSMKPEAFSSLRNYFPCCLLIPVERLIQCTGSSRALCLHNQLPLAVPIRADISRASITMCYSQPVFVRKQPENSDGYWQFSLDTQAQQQFTSHVRTIMRRAYIITHKKSYVKGYYKGSTFILSEIRKCQN